ncbi:MAG: ATP-dependent helicase, partial [Candidatus Dormibacteria bacterium]
MSSAADPAQVLDAAPSEEQLAVVGRLGFGPVKVVAAAGSGKTTTMAHLYAAGVASGLELGQIMAVTFTERAALELRHKVDRALEAEGAGPVVGDAEAGWIGTFHQLVRRLLNERSYLAGLPRDLDLIDEVEAAAEMSAAVASVSGHAGEAGWFSRLPAGVPPRAPLSLVQDVGRVVGRLRSTPLTPEECRRLSERTYARFLTHGDPAEEVGWHRAGLWLTLVVWEEYEGRLRRRGAVDFDGLLRQGLEALQHSPELLSWCRRKFRLVIVDEYQDTSAIQESLVKELTGPEGRNLFVVGDARQSIYGFRDANPDAMDQAQGSLLPLVSNYRSRESIVAAADHVIRHDARFGADSEMRAMRRQASRLPVLLAEVEGPEAEGEAIAAALELVHQFGLTFPDGSAQPVAWREMAVLARTLGRLGRPLEEALRRRGVPFEMAGGALLKRPEVLDLLAYLRLAADERDDLACLRVLQGPICRIPDRALLSLRAGADSRSLPLARRLRRHLDRGAPGWDAPWADRAREALATLELLAQRARLGTASEVMALALERTQLWQLQEVRMAAGQPDAERARASLAELQRLAWDMQTPRRWLTLAGLLRGLDLLSLQSGSAEPPAMAGDDRVTLSTIHRAKGLEWPLVVLADCRPFHQGRRGTMLWDRGERALICSKFQAGDTAAYSRWKASGEGRLERDEHRRLVYVAMTRARDLLLVSTSRAGEKGEFVELATAADAGRDWVSRWPGFGATQDPPWAPGRGSLEPLAQLPSPSPARPLAWSAVEERLGQLERLWGVPVRTDPAIERLSYTAIQMLYECPRQFWFRYVAQFPEAEAPAGG